MKRDLSTRNGAEDAQVLIGCFTFAFLVLWTIIMVLAVIGLAQWVIG